MNPDYLSYLLRLWQEGEEKKTWRASLENSRTGERRGFASLDDLYRYLLGETSTAPGVNINEDEDRKRR